MWNTVLDFAFVSVGVSRLGLSLETNFVRSRSRSRRFRASVSKATGLGNNLIILPCFSAWKISLSKASEVQLVSGLLCLKVSKNQNMH